MACVASLTPAPLDRDSRTLKEATTIARLGHASVVVQAQSSAQAFADAPFSVFADLAVTSPLYDTTGGSLVSMARTW